MEERNDVGTIDTLALVFLIPICKLVADADEGRSLGARGMSICIPDTTFIDHIVKVCSDGHEEPLCSLTHAGGISLGKIA
jgi:hypothetical protein